MGDNDVRVTQRDIDSAVDFSSNEIEKETAETYVG